jgi:hypothetical protein
VGELGTKAPSRQIFAHPSPTGVHRGWTVAQSRRQHPLPTRLTKGRPAGLKVVDSGANPWSCGGHARPTWPPFSGSSSCSYQWRPWPACSPESLRVVPRRKTRPAAAPRATSRYRRSPATRHPRYGPCRCRLLAAARCIRELGRLSLLVRLRIGLDSRASRAQRTGDGVYRGWGT